MWVLLHGFTGSPRSWDPVIACRESAPPPLRPALYGHDSGWRDLPVRSFRDEVERLCELSSHTSRPRFLAGYSLGARVALGMLARSPELFDGALLVGLHPGLTDEAERRSRREADARRADMLETAGLAAFVEAWESEPLFDTQNRLPDSAREEQRRIRLAHDPAGLASSLRALGLSEMPSYEDALCASRVPTTLMAGALDSKFRSIANVLRARCAMLDVVVVDEAGHNLLLEAADAVAEALHEVERRALGSAKS